MSVLPGNAHMVMLRNVGERVTDFLEGEDWRKLSSFLTDILGYECDS